MALSLHQLKILGIIAGNTVEKNWFRKGSFHVAQEMQYPQDEIQVGLRVLIHEGYLEQGIPHIGEKHIPLRLTEKAQGERVKLFNMCFADIKSMLLTKR